MRPSVRTVLIPVPVTYHRTPLHVREPRKWARPATYDVSTSTASSSPRHRYSTSIPVQDAAWRSLASLPVCAGLRTSHSDTPSDLPRHARAQQMEPAPCHLPRVDVYGQVQPRNTGESTWNPARDAACPARAGTVMFGLRASSSDATSWHLPLNRGTLLQVGLHSRTPTTPSGTYGSTPSSLVSPVTKPESASLNRIRVCAVSFDV
jgi:hypothetical protein